MMAQKLGTIDDLDVDPPQHCVAILVGLFHQVEMLFDMADVLRLQISNPDVFDLWLVPIRDPRIAPETVECLGGDGMRTRHGKDVAFVDRHANFTAPVVGSSCARIDDVWKQAVCFCGTFEKRSSQTLTEPIWIHPMQLSIEDVTVDHTAQLRVRLCVWVSIP